MNNPTDKSVSQLSDKVSMETMISMNRYNQNAGDGPQNCQSPDEGTQFSECELKVETKKSPIQADKFKNQLLSEIITLKSAEAKSVYNSSQSLNLEKCKESQSNKSFSVTSSIDTAISELLKSLHGLLDKYKTKTNVAKIELSQEIERLGTLVMKKENCKKINSDNMFCPSEIQKLQIHLHYFLEQISHNVTLLDDIQFQMNNLNQIKKEEVENVHESDKKSIMSHNVIEKSSAQKKTDEDDIFSVEELSWDEHILHVEKPKVACNCSLEKKMLDDKEMYNNVSNEYKTFSVSSNKDLAERIEVFGKHSTINEVSNKLDKLNFQVEEIDPFNSENIKKENNIHSNVPVKRPRKPRTLKENFKTEACDELPDNSAFLVSSIESFSESISLNNLKSCNQVNDNNLACTFPLFTDIQKSPSIAVDVIAEKILLKEFTKQNNCKDFNKINYTKLKMNQPESSLFSSNSKLSEHINGEKSSQVYVEDILISEKKSIKELSNKDFSEDIILSHSHVKENIHDKNNDKEIAKIEKSSTYHYVKEFIDTEKSYVSGLYILSEILNSKIKTANVLSVRNINLIFPSSIQQIYKFHLDFSKGLDNLVKQNLKSELVSVTKKETPSRSETVKIGQLFLEHIEKNNWIFFTIYRHYFTKSKAAIQTFNKLKRSSPKFERVIKNLQHNEHCNGLDLGSFLVLPIQRLPRYLMIFRKILDNLQSTETEERVSILAIEHLLHCFLKENDKKPVKSIRTFDRGVDPHSNSRNEECNINIITRSPNPSEASKDKGEQSELILKRFKSKTMKKILSNGGTTASAKDSQKTSVSIPQIESKLSDISHFPNNALKVASLPVNASVEFSSDMISRNENQRIIDSYHPQHHSSSPLLFSTKVYSLSSKHHVTQKEKTSPKENKKASSDLLRTDRSNECSVCLHSQDEFEIDTSTDERTCIEGQNTVTTITTNVTASTPPRIEKILKKKSASLIEFCQTNDIYQKSDCSSSHLHYTSNKQAMIDLKYRCINDFVNTEIVKIINKKVDSLVVIFAHVAMESTSLFSKNMLSVVSDRESMKECLEMKNKSLYCSKNFQLGIDIPVDETKSMTNIRHYNEYKTNSKKFSIKQLFSLRRKGHIENVGNNSSTASTGPQNTAEHGSDYPVSNRTVSHHSFHKKLCFMNKNEKCKQLS